MYIYIYIYIQTTPTRSSFLSSEIESFCPAFLQLLFSFCQSCSSFSPAFLQLFSSFCQNLSSFCPAFVKICPAFVERHAPGLHHKISVFSDPDPGKS